MLHPGLYYITDSTLTRQDIFTDCEQALKAGVKTVQYREKQLPTEKRVEEALKLKALCHSYGANLIINDTTEIARRVTADGLHVGQDDMDISEARKLVPGMMIGLSTHSVQQAIDAEQAGADYIGFGPVFNTSTKNNAGMQRGVEELAEVVKSVNIPVVAIGGISSRNLRDVIATSVSNVAIISDIITADNIERKVTELIAEF